MARKKTKSCYMCPEPGISREHAPMQSLFPPDPEKRVQLITVPSCPRHNSKKSNDDDYVARLIRFHFGNNDYASDIDGLARAVKKNNRLGRDIFKNFRPVLIAGRETATMEVDLKRFWRVIDHMARAIHYDHTNGKKYLDPLGFWSSGLFFVDEPKAALANRKNRQLGNYLMRLCAKHPYFGRNPEIFQYQFYLELPNTIIIRMVFFEGLELVAHTAREWDDSVVIVEAELSNS